MGKVKKRSAKENAPGKGSLTAQQSPAEPAKGDLNRRQSRDRRKTDRRQQDLPVAVDRRKSERRKVQRRRQIDPTTCERDYSQDELEFMSALDAYKRSSGRMFPTCSEILEVIRGLGYERLPKTPPLCSPMEGGDAAAASGDPSTQPMAG